MKYIILILLLLYPIQVQAVTAIRVRRTITTQVKARSSARGSVLINAERLSPKRSDSNDLSAPKFQSEAWGKVPDYQEYKTIGKYKNRQIIALIYFSESNYGKHDVCREKGKFNGFGYNEWTGHSPTCYDSFDKVVSLVDAWIEDKSNKGMSFNRMNCYYVRGLDQENCDTAYKLTPIEL